MNVCTEQCAIAFSVLDQKGVGFTAMLPIVKFYEMLACEPETTDDAGPTLLRNSREMFHIYLDKPSTENSCAVSMLTYFYMCSICPDFTEHVLSTFRKNGSAWITVIMHTDLKYLAGTVTAEPINEEFTEFLHRTAQETGKTAVYSGSTGWVH